MGKELTEQRTVDREMQVWRLRCQGLPQWQVAEQVGISQQAVSKILDRLARRFQSEFVEEVRQVKLEQTMVLQTVASEALTAWEKSKEDAELVRDTEKWIVPKDGGEPYQLTDRTHERRGQAGDAALLAQARGALSDIRDVWGLNAPARAQLSGPDGGPIPLFTEVVVELPRAEEETRPVDEAELVAPSEEELLLPAAATPSFEVVVDLP